MSIFLFAPFNLQQEDINLTIQITGSGGSSIEYNKTTGSFFTAFSASIEDINYLNFLSEFANFLSSSDFGIWQTGYNFATSQYFISCSQSGSLANGALIKFDTLSSQILGMQDGISTGQKIYNSSIGSKFTWVSTQDKWTKISYPYEGKTIIKEEQCTDGRVYALSNEDGVPWLSNINGNYTWFDWTFEYENKSNLFSDFSSSLNPNTFEEIFKHVRSYRPFIVFQPTNTTTTGSYNERYGTFKIRADKSQFKSKPSLTNYDQLWDFTVMARRLSTGSNFNQ